MDGRTDGRTESRGPLRSGGSEQQSGWQRIGSARVYACPFVESVLQVPFSLRRALGQLSQTIDHTHAKHMACSNTLGSNALLRWGGGMELLNWKTAPLTTHLTGHGAHAVPHNMHSLTPQLAFPPSRASKPPRATRARTHAHRGRATRSPRHASSCNPSRNPHTFNPRRQPAASGARRSPS